MTDGILTDVAVAALEGHNGTAQFKSSHRVESWTESAHGVAWLERLLGIMVGSLPLALLYAALSEFFA